LNRLGLCCALFVLMPVYAESQPHEKVQTALDWALPVNACIKPKMIAVTAKVTDSEGSRTQTDVDSYTIGRYQRKEKRWNSCVEKYKSDLMVEFSELKDSAQYGVTKAQADIIMGNMAMIQSVYLSPDGRIEAP